MIQRADIDIQPLADAGNLCRLLQIIRHNRRSAAGQQHVCAVIHRHIIGDAVDKR